MKKTEQEDINRIAEKYFDEAMEEYANYHKDLGRLRTCSAGVYETDNFYLLRSYRTIIAVIDKRTDTLYDVLRIVYGYTATSAQHISKFESDYCRGKWSCSSVYIAR